LGFNEISEKYYGENYAPHLTIADSSSDFDKDCDVLSSQIGFISQYFLSKKIKNDWRKIETFCSS